MHSLGHGEGRAGLLSNSKYMHWLQDKMGLGSLCEWQPCQWVGQLSEAVSCQVSEGGRCHGSSPYITMLFALWICSMEACYTGKKGRGREQTRSRDRRERERETDYHQCGQKDISRDAMPSTLTDILRTTLPPLKKKLLGVGVGWVDCFLNLDFVNASWHWNYEI